MQQQQDSVLPSPSRSLETLQRHTDEALPRPLLPSPPPDPFPSEGLPIPGCCLAVQDPQDSNHCRLPIQGEQAFSLSVSETGTEEGLACPPCYPKEAHVSQN